MYQRSERGRRSGLMLLGVFIFLLTGSLTAFGQTQAQEQGTLTQTFSFERPLLRTIEVNGESYTSLAMPGSITLGERAGMPALPVHYTQILLPPGKTVAKITVTGTAQDCTPDNVDLRSNPIFAYQNPVPIGSAPQEELYFDESVYGSADPTPATNYRGANTGFCRGYAIFSIGLHPLRYAPASGTLSYYPEMILEIELADTGEINPFLRPGKTSDAEWVGNLVRNPSAIKDYSSLPFNRAEYPGGLCDPADDYDYVIITTTQNSLDYWATNPSTPYNWDSLMAKHTALDGFACTLVTVQDIMAESDYENSDPLFNDTEARVREFCRDAYQDWGIDYVMIGADAEWIPAREMDYQYEYNVDSDIYWNHLDNTFNDDHDSYWGESGDTGFDLYAEMFIGRVTCDVPQDVSNWLNKSFYYVDAVDKDYLDNAAFYGGNTGWSCQGDDFIDYSAIYGCDQWLGPDPWNNDPPYPSWLGFQYGFETWNLENPGCEYDMTCMWTAEPPNAGGWMGGSESAAITGFRNDISDDKVALISGIAHANEYMSLDVYYDDWEDLYHNSVPFFIHDYGCHCGDMDAADDGVLHSMLFHSDTELAFGCVYNTGYGWGNFDNTGSSSALQQKSFWDYMFDVANNSGSVLNWQTGKAMAYARDLMAPLIDEDPSYGTWRGIIQSCLLFGDPGQVIKPPVMPTLIYNFPAGLPEGFHPPGPTTDVTLEIREGEEQLIPGSAYMHYRFDPNDNYTSVQLVSLGNDLFEAQLPNTAPGDEPEFYFSAEGNGGSTVYSPPFAPLATYSFTVCMVRTFFEDDFESDRNWKVTNIAVQAGEWVRDVPIGNGNYGDPVNDADGSGHCFITGNDSSYDDVDGGPTWLTSPAFDLSSGDAEVSFYSWFYNDDGDDPFTVSVSNDNGANWAAVDSTMGGEGGWIQKSFRVADFVTPSSQVKVRFATKDQPDNSMTEAGVDGFLVKRLITEPALWAQAYSFSAPTGCSIPALLDAGVANAGRHYVLGASLSGSSPGYTLPGGLVLPLNWDWVTSLVVSNPGHPAFVNFHGDLDGSGAASATLNIGAGVAAPYVGKELTLAFALTGNFDFVSDPIEIEITP